MTDDKILCKICNLKYLTRNFIKHMEKNHPLILGSLLSQVGYVHD
jgi:hypothetical protein